MKTLTRIIPERKEVLKIVAYRKNFLIFDEIYIKARASFKNKLDHCSFCNYKFEIGDNLGLACIKNRKNMILCDKCIEILDNQQDE